MRQRMVLFVNGKQKEWMFQFDGDPAHIEGRPASMPTQDSRVVELEKQLSETRKHLDAALHELAYGTHTMAQQFNRESP